MYSFDFVLRIQYQYKVGNLDGDLNHHEGSNCHLQRYLSLFFGVNWRRRHPSRRRRTVDCGRWGYGSSIRAHGETGMALQARWEAGGFLPRLPESAEQLALLLLTVPKARRVHQDGIQFQGLRYLDLTLAAYVGQPVTIRYDPRDLAELRVYHRDRFLCRAVCPELAGRRST